VCTLNAIHSTNEGIYNFIHFTREIYYEYIWQSQTADGGAQDNKSNLSKVRNTKYKVCITKDRFAERIAQQLDPNIN